MKIWVIYDSDNEVMNAFKKKPTLKSLRAFYNLDQEDAGIARQIAEDLLATAQAVELS